MREGEQIDPREPIRNEQILVGTSSTSLCKAHTGQNYRRDLVIRNISTNAVSVISISLNALAQNNIGIVLKQNEAVTFSQDQGPIIFQGDVNAICADANGIITLMER